jgi:hypothetical protein
MRPFLRQGNRQFSLAPDSCFAEALSVYRLTQRETLPSSGKQTDTMSNAGCFADERSVSDLSL